MDQLKESKAADLQDAVRNEQRLQEANLQLDAEVSRLQALSKDLKDGFLKTRDLLRVEQTSLEAMKTKTLTLEEQLETYKIEIERLQDESLKTTEINKQQINALVASMDELERKHEQEMATLRRDLANQFSIQSSVQQDAIDWRNRVDTERAVGLRKLGVHRLCDAMVSWKRRRLATWFRQWHTMNTLMGAAEQFRETLNKAVKRATDEGHQDRERAVEGLRSLLRNEHEVDKVERIICDLVLYHRSLYFVQMLSFPSA